MNARITADEARKIAADNAERRQKDLDNVYEFWFNMVQNRIKEAAQKAKFVASVKENIHLLRRAQEDLKRLGFVTEIKFGPSYPELLITWGPNVHYIAQYTPCGRSTV
jgi:hypothetical protein